ncbi:MAG: HAD-IA family hydrolase, partial [Verrucomicrobiota bacterium]
FDLFQGGVYSQRARSMKPDGKIYLQAIEELKLEPASTAYVDDLKANVEAGIEHGFMAVHYDPDDHQSLVRGLGRYGVSL